MPRGTCTIYNWVDTYNLKDDFGISLSDGAISTLLSPPAAKERVSNESRLENGKRIDIDTPTYFQSRDLTLEMHLIASSFEDYIAKWRSFLSAITATGEGIKLSFRIYEQTLVFDLQYVSCTQFAVYNGTLGKFAVRFTERVPMNGTASLSVS
jgi:hypothetical protein